MDANYGELMNLTRLNRLNWKKILYLFFGTQIYGYFFMDNSYTFPFKNSLFRQVKSPNTKYVSLYIKNG